MDNTQWDRHSRAPMVSEAQYMPKCAPIDPSAGSYLAVTQQPNSMSIGSLVGPAIHPDLAGDCGMMWNGMPLHSEHQTPLFPGNHIHESVEDTRFYGSPETCSSPSSDGATLSIPSHPRSSLSSTPVVVDPYPENIIDSDLSSSPMSMHSNIRCWDQQDAGLHSMVPLSLHDSLVQPVSSPSRIFSDSGSKANALSAPSVPLPFSRMVCTPPLGIRRALSSPGYTLRHSHGLEAAVGHLEPEHTPSRKARVGFQHTT